LLAQAVSTTMAEAAVHISLIMVLRAHSNVLQLSVLFSILLLILVLSCLHRKDRKKNETAFNYRQLSSAPGRSLSGGS
jgi:hypothetical protein